MIGTGPGRTYPQETILDPRAIYGLLEYNVNLLEEMLVKAGGKNFERALVSALNIMYIDYDIDALAYRRWAPPRVEQEMDIVSDSLEGKYYFAIECKSVDGRKTDSLYWSQHFSATPAGHQIDRECSWLRMTGRTGYLAVEIRSGSGSAREAYLYPYQQLARIKKSTALGISLDRIRSGVRLGRVGTQYTIDPDMIYMAGKV